MRYDPFTGQPNVPLRSSILQIINETAVVENTVSAVFEDLFVASTFTFAGLSTLFVLDLSLFLSVGTNTTVELAVQVDGGADVAIGSFFLTQLDNHSSIGLSILSAVPAGDHQITLRWRREAGTGTINIGTDDSIQLTALQL